MQQSEIVVRNRFGLHMRAAARITQVARSFSSSVVLVVNGRAANARSLMAIMVLAASMGTRVSIEVAGPDEAEALQAVTKLFDDRFGDPR